MPENKFNSFNLVKDNFEDIKIATMISEVHKEEEFQNYCDNFIEINML